MILEMLSLIYGVCLGVAYLNYEKNVNRMKRLLKQIPNLESD